MAFTRYHVGAVVPASSDAAGIMGALATLTSVANDVDTGAAVSALTWTRDTTAGSQAIYSSAFGPRNTRIIIAVHDVGSPASGPQMASDTYTAANVLVGLCDNAAGNYIAWYSTAGNGPFYQSGGAGAACNFAGYHRLGATASATLGEIRLWVSAKDLWLQYRNGTTIVETAHIGAIVQGATGYQESDTYRYGALVSGVGDMASQWRAQTAATAGYFGKHSATNGAPHAYLYDVGATTNKTIRMKTICLSAQTANFSKWASAGPVFANSGLPMQAVSSPELDVGSWLGVADGCSGQTASIVNTTGPTLWGWLLSATVSGTEDSVVIAKSVA